MRRCAGCGGVLGQDCFNEAECVWITEDMERRAYEEVREDEAEYWRQEEADHYDDMAYDLWWHLIYAGPAPTGPVLVPDRRTWAIV